MRVGDGKQLCNSMWPKGKFKPGEAPGSYNAGGNPVQAVRMVLASYPGPTKGLVHIVCACV